MSIIFFFAFCTFCNLYFWLCTFCALLRQHKILLPVACFHLSWRKFCLLFISTIRPIRPQPRFYLHSRWFSEVGVACFQQSWERRILSVAFDVLPRKTRQIKNSEGVRHNGLSEIVTPVFWEDGFQIAIQSHFIALVKIDLGQGLNKQTLWHSTFFSFQPNWGFKMGDYDKCFLKNLFLVKMISWTLTGGKSRQIAASLWSF